MLVEISGYIFLILIAARIITKLFKFIYKKVKKNKNNQEMAPYYILEMKDDIIDFVKNTVLQSGNKNIDSDALADTVIESFIDIGDIDLEIINSISDKQLKSIVKNIIIENIDVIMEYCSIKSAEERNTLGKDTLPKHQKNKHDKIDQMDGTVYALDMLNTFYDDDSDV